MFGFPLCLSQALGLDFFWFSLLLYSSFWIWMLFGFFQVWDFVWMFTALQQDCWVWIFLVFLLDIVFCFDDVNLQPENAHNNYFATAFSKTYSNIECC
jgi:hypothetical protein